jgi:hypothetical protein
MAKFREKDSSIDFHLNPKPMKTISAHEAQEVYLAACFGAKPRLLWPQIHPAAAKNKLLSVGFIL